jgi:Domain of Unknown Function (DUF1080)
MKHLFFFYVIVFAVASLHAQDNQLTKSQQDDGFIRLFDGKTFNGWKGAFIDGIPAKGWQVKDGLLMVEPSGGKESVNGGDIVTLGLYDNFELWVDFKLTEGGNSGIKYFVDPAQPVPDNPRSAFGLEFQLLDDARHPDAALGKNGNRTLGSLYDLIAAPAVKPLHPVGEWNTVRIVSFQRHVEHWLNGVKLLEYDRGSSAFSALVAGSKYKGIPGFGEVAEGRILLQDHGDRVYFKNIYLKPLKTSPK